MTHSALPELRNYTRACKMGYFLTQQVTENRSNPYNGTII